MPWAPEELQEAIAAAKEAGDMGAAQRLADELARVTKSPTASAAPREEFTAETEPMARRIPKTIARTMLSGTVGWPGDIQSMSDNLGLTSGKKYFMNTPEIVELIKRETGLDLTSPKATKWSEAFPDRAAAGATAMLGLGRGSLAKQAAVGAIAGAMGEGAVRGSGSENARLPAELLSLLGGNITNFRTPNVVKALKSDLMEFSPEDMKKAQSRTNQATAELGTPAIVSQGFDHPNSLAATTNELLRTASGYRLRSALTEQMKKAKSLGERFVDDLTPTKDLGREAELRVGEVGKTAVDRPAKWRGERTAQAYKAAGQADLPLGWEDALTAVLERRREAMNLPSALEGGKALAKAKKTVGKIAEEAGPDANPLQVAALAKEEGTAAQKAFSTKDAKGKDLNRALGQSATSQEVKTWLKATSPEFAAAETLHKRYSGPVDQMRSSKMPDIFGKESGDPSWAKFSQVLTDDTIKPDQVRYIARQLEFSDPTKQAFPEIVKQHWQLEWQKAFADPKGMVKQTGPGSFALAVAGMPDSPKRAKFLAEMEEVARVRGLPPQEYARASEALVDAFQTASRGRDALHTIDAKELRRRSGANWVSAGFRTPGLIVGGSPVAAALERMVGERTNKQVVDALLHNEGIVELMKIRDYSTMKNAAEVMARNILATTELSGSVNPEKTAE